MIITFEGAPAVGKSTISQAMAASHQSFVVPEVNKLFARPQVEPENWYLERQVARWEMGLRQIKQFRSIIFDGDLFQPLWFSWIYNDESWTDLSTGENFFRREIINGRIGFPDVYYFLYINPQERFQRECDRGSQLNLDRKVIENKYHRFARMVEPQRQYFYALKAAFPHRVYFLESRSIEENTQVISSSSKPQKREPDLEIFEFLISFLKTHHPQG